MECAPRTSLQHYPINIAYNDPSALAKHAAQLAPTAAFTELPGKKWGELALWKIQYTHSIPRYQPEYAAVTFIDRSSIATNTDGFIEYDILAVRFDRRRQFQFMTMRQVLMPANDEAEHIKKDLTALEHFEEPGFYTDIAARSILASNTNADLRTTHDLNLEEVEYNYFSRPQIAEVAFQVAGTLKKTGKQSYTWKSKSAKLLPSGKVLENDESSQADPFSEGRASPPPLRSSRGISCAKG